MTQEESDWRYDTEELQYINTEQKSPIREKIELAVAIFFVLLTLWIIFHAVQSGSIGTYEYSRIMYTLV